MNIRESSYGYWSSPSSFLWVAAGATVGLSNLTRVPYLMSEYGGSAFLAVYVLSLLLIGLPLLMAEWMLGRWMRSDLVAGFRLMAETARASRGWGLVGVLALISGVLILSYYAVVAGWGMAYTFRMGAGNFSGMSESDATGVFLSLAQDPERSLSWHTIFMIIASLVVAHGFREGIERAAVRLMPVAVLIGTALCAYALRQEGAGPALSLLLTPDFSRLGWRGALEAMHQAFFTLSLGIGVMLNLGVYLRADAPMVRLALGLLVLDVLFSVVVGVAVFSLIFSAGLLPAPGLALIFQVLPRSLPEGLPGIVFGVGFYLTLVLITLCSATALLEPLTRYLMDRLRWTRVFAAATSALTVWYLGIGSLLSFSILQDMTLFGRNFFEWVQFVTISVLAPALALMVTVFVSSIMPRELSRGIWGERAGWQYRWWLGLLRYPVRIGLIVILLYATGLLGRIIEFWSA